MIMANSYRGATVNTKKAELVEQEFIYRGVKYISTIHYYFFYNIFFLKKKGNSIFICNLHRPFLLPNHQNYIVEPILVLF